MGLFGRQDSRQTAETPAGPKPISPDEVQLDVLRDIVTNLCSAIGTSNPQIDAAIARLRTACGMVDPDKAMATMSAYDADPGYFDRPGRWLAVGAAKANASDQSDLAVLAYAWIFMWTTSMEPKLSGSNLIVLGLNRTPRDAVEALIKQAEIALPRINPDQVLVTTGTSEELTGRMIVAALEQHKASLQDAPSA
jgi:hypothetical protein